MKPKVKMKPAFIVAIFCSLSFWGGCAAESEQVQSPENQADEISATSEVGETSKSTSETTVTKISDEIVEASCGQCKFGMEGSGCDLAIRIDGKSYYVDGSSIDDHGDAHADDGLCNQIRKAKVTGEIKDGRFLAESIQVLPTEK